MVNQKILVVLIVILLTLLLCRKMIMDYFQNNMDASKLVKTKANTPSPQTPTPEPLPKEYDMVRTALSLASRPETKFFSNNKNYSDVCKKLDFALQNGLAKLYKNVMGKDSVITQLNCFNGMTIPQVREQANLIDKICDEMMLTLLKNIKQNKESQNTNYMNYLSLFLIMCSFSLDSISVDIKDYTVQCVYNNNPVKVGNLIPIDTQPTNFVSDAMQIASQVVTPYEIQTIRKTHAMLTRIPIDIFVKILIYRTAIFGFPKEIDGYDFPPISTPVPKGAVPTVTRSSSMPTPTPTSYIPTPTPTSYIPTPTPTSYEPTPTPTSYIPTPTPTSYYEPTPTVFMNNPTPTPYEAASYIPSGYNEEPTPTVFMNTDTTPTPSTIFTNATPTPTPIPSTPLDIGLMWVSQRNIGGIIGRYCNLQKKRIQGLTILYKNLMNKEYVDNDLSSFKCAANMKKSEFKLPADAIQKLSTLLFETIVNKIKEGRDLQNQYYNMVSLYLLSYSGDMYDVKLHNSGLEFTRRVYDSEKKQFIINQVKLKDLPPSTTSSSTLSEKERIKQLCSGVVSESEINSFINNDTTILTPEQISKVFIYSCMKTGKLNIN